MPTLFVDRDFRTLQVLMHLFKALTKYYDPELSGFLEDQGIGPELYASPWFLTLFASKIEDISIVFSLWEAYMTENDHLYSLFLSVALVTVNRKRILRSQKSRVAQTLTELTIPTARHLSKILDQASVLKKNLPYSVYIQLAKHPLQNLDQLDALLNRLEVSDSLAIMPREVIMRCYPAVFKCMCFAGTCQWCTRSIKPVPLVILDCRLPEEQETGVLPNTLLFDYESAEFIEKVLALRGEFHIALMGGQVQNIMWELRKLNVPYISEVEGGFKDCHDLAMSFNLNLEAHEPEICLACNPENAFGLKKQIRSLRKSLLWKVKQAVSFAEGALSRGSQESSLAKSSASVDASLELGEAKQEQNCKIFLCRKLDRNTGQAVGDVCHLVVSMKELVLRSIEDEPKRYVIEKADIKDLLKITSKRQSSNTLTFYFKGDENTEVKRSYVLHNPEDSKACISLVSKYFNALVPHSYAAAVQCNN